MPDDTKPRGPQPDPLTKAVKKDDNPYEYTDEEKSDFGTYDLNTPIARAWSRMRRKGHHLGIPTDSGKTQMKVRSQSFQYSVALMRDEEDNKNQVVQFYDARGLIGEESGL